MASVICRIITTVFMVLRLAYVAHSFPIPPSLGLWGMHCCMILTKATSSPFGTFLGMHCYMNFPGNKQPICWLCLWSIYDDQSQLVASSLQIWYDSKNISHLGIKTFNNAGCCVSDIGKACVPVYRGALFSSHISHSFIAYIRRIIHVHTMVCCMHLVHITVPSIQWCLRCMFAYQPSFSHPKVLFKCP